MGKVGKGLKGSLGLGVPLVGSHQYATTGMENMEKADKGGGHVLVGGHKVKIWWRSSQELHAFDSMRQSSKSLTFTHPFIPFPEKTFLKLVEDGFLTAKSADFVGQVKPNGLVEFSMALQTFTA